MTVPDILVERLALGELPPDRAAEVLARLEAAGELHRLEDLERSNAARLSEWTPEDFARDLRRYGGEPRHADAPAAPRARPRGAGAWAGAVAAVAAAVLIAVRPAPPADAPSTGGELAVEHTTAKGHVHPDLTVYRLAGSEVERLSDGDGAWAGDRLQLSYYAGDAGWGMLFSLDGAGAITLHGDAPFALEPGGWTSLPLSYELDDAPEFERFFLVASPSTFDAAPVLDAARALDAADSQALQLPSPLSVVDVTLRKRR